MERGRFTYRRGRSRGSDHPGHRHDVPESSGRECQGHSQCSDRSRETFHRNRPPDYYVSHGEHSDYYRRHSDQSPDHYRGYETRRYRNRSPDFYVERHDYQRSRSPDYHQRWGREECVRSQPADLYDRYTLEIIEVVKKVGIGHQVPIIEKSIGLKEMSELILSQVTR